MSSETRKKLPLRKYITKAMIVIVIVSAAFIAYEAGRHANYWGEPNELRAIKAEKLASKDLLGLELVEALEYGKNSLFRKTTSPQIERTFYSLGLSTAELQSKIVSYAEKDGWVKIEGHAPEGAWWASKDVKGLDLGIHINKSVKHQGAVRVVIL